MLALPLEKRPSTNITFTTMNLSGKGEARQPFRAADLIHIKLLIANQPLPWQQNFLAEEQAHYAPNRSSRTRFIQPA